MARPTPLRHSGSTLHGITPPGPITHRTIDRVLIPGFGSVIGLLLAAGFIGINSARVVQESGAGLLQNQRLAVGLITELRNEEEILDSVFYAASTGAATADRNRILTQLDASDLALRRIFEQTRGTADDAAWQQLKQAAQAFSNAARAVLANPGLRSPSLPDLFRFHQKVTAAAAQIVTGGFERGLAAQKQIERRSSNWLKESVALLGGSLALALMCTIVTLRVTARLVRGMEEQSGELSRVSWHMLENQETTARRFSHELHDELGQTLTALKANLSALRATNSAWLMKLSVMCANSRSYCIPPSLTISVWMPACVGSANGSRREPESRSNMNPILMSASRKTRKYMYFV